MKNGRNFYICVAIFVVCITFPYLYAGYWGGDKYQFGGFLLNPLDGNSYLAKEYQGWSGSWNFILPYTVDKGDGTYLFLFYLFLGHLSRWLNIPLIWTFHIARVLSSLALVWVLRLFYRVLFEDNEVLVRRTWTLAIFGSGMGWVALFIMGMTADFWVAEAYPFLASYANPHFPLGLTLVLLVLIEAIRQPEKTGLQTLRIAVISLIISVILPFGAVILFIILSGELLIELYRKEKFKWQPIVGLAAGSGPVLIYQFVIVQVDPLLAIWNSQNLTPSPSIVDFIFSFSPAIILAAAAFIVKRDFSIKERWLVIWAIAGLILVYIPISLQRRFMTGYFIPVSGLAMIGLGELIKKYRIQKKFLFGGTLVLSILTNVFVILAGFSGLNRFDPALYLQNDEVSALAWILENTSSDAIVLASPEMGLYIPAYTGRRVLYGHPFETINADREKAEVEKIFSGEVNVPDIVNYLHGRKVNFVLYGNREKDLGRVELFRNCIPAMEVGDVKICAVDKNLW